MANRLKSLSLYREHTNTPNCLELPTIEDNMNVLSKELAQEIAEYFESGLVLLEFVSPTEDLYDPNHLVPYTIYTDGIYQWDAMIIHWIRKYRIRLPHEFIEYFNNLKVKRVDKTSLDLELLDSYDRPIPIFCEN